MALNTSQNNLSISESVTENEYLVQQESDTRKRLKSRKKKNLKRSVNSTIVCISPETAIVSRARKRHRSVLPIVSTMTAYEYYTPSLSPVVNEWTPIMHSFYIPRPIYTMAYRPLPVTVFRPRHLSRSMCPFACTTMRPQLLTPIMSPMVTEISSVGITQPYVIDVPPEPSQIYEPVAHYPITDTVEDAIPSSYEEVYDEVPDGGMDDEIPDDNIYDGEIPAENISHEETAENVQYNDITDTDEETNLDPLENYLLLPRDLFPTTRMHAIDPNPLIDAFCNFKDLYRHVSWILDLEFGIPRHAVTRPIPMYNVKFYSIHCKNAPDAIHPGFESCSEDFKSALLFYYDCIISSWYTGYMVFNDDNSVENFQSWLQLPMQMFGMCWP